MPDDRTFMMGKFAAHLPGDLLYARNHMWARQSEGKLRFGFTAYAIRLMQDVYFLEWHLSPGDAVTQLQLIGHIETSKALSDLFAPQEWETQWQVAEQVLETRQPQTGTQGAVLKVLPFTEGFMVLTD